MITQLAKRSYLISFILLAFAFPVGAQSKAEFFHGDEVVANEVLVRFKGGELQAGFQRVHASDIDSIEPVGSGVVLKVHSSLRNVATLLHEMSMRGDVDYVEPNYIVHAVDTIPNDPLFGSLYGMTKISAPSAWDISTGSRASVVGVVDSGIDYTHADLGANVWSAPADFTVNVGGQIHCSAGSHGFNAINRTCDPLDDYSVSHGTHVSGTIGAIGNNGTGVVGVNWTASIMGLKFIDSSGSGQTSDAINAIEFAIQTKNYFGCCFGSGALVRVLSNSWGGTSFSQSLSDEISRANANGMLFVAAAGNASQNNDSNPFYPASYNLPNVIAVAATDSGDSLASFSDYGQNSVALGAPGVGILSTIIGGQYGYLDGTSMATPHVSGAAALVLSVCPATTANLKTVILNTVDPVPSLAGKTITGGRLNVNRASRSFPNCVPGTATVTITGSEQNVNWCASWGGTCYGPDSGTVGFTIQGNTYTTNYGSGDTQESVAFYLRGAINASPDVSASVNGNVITVTARLVGGDANYSFTTWMHSNASGASPSFFADPSDGALTAGIN